MKTFEVAYLIQKNKFTIDEYTLTVKYGMRSMKVNLSDIKHFRKFDDHGYDTLMIQYYNKNKKLKLHHTLVDKSDPEIDRLIEYLRSKLPDKDLSDLSKKEALGIMKTTGMATFVALVTTIVSAIFIPFSLWLLHHLDISIGFFLKILLLSIPFASLFLYIKYKRHDAKNKS